MKYGSVCSGIEAATAAWHPLGWTPAWFAEIEAFPSAVLAHHYPQVPNHGDFTQLIDNSPEGVDVLVGGTPCQAFSVAGLRQGLADHRGGLTLEFLRLARALRPKWIVWENVPGVLSQDGGRAFGAFLGGLEDLRYGWAYRVLDAQYFGLAQRRKRVFVVGCAGGDFARAAAVLFEPEGLRRDSPPRREAGAGAGVAGAISTGASGGGGRLIGADEAAASQIVPYGGGDVAWPATIAPTLYALMGEKMGMENQHINSGAGHFVPTLSPCLETQVGGLRHPDTQAYVVNAMPVSLGKGLGHNKDDYCVPSTQGVRRLTPTECERLQGFPDGHTLVSYRGKAAKDCPDGPRYKALGNSMAVPVMRWIGERIALAEALAEALDQAPPVPSVPSVPAWLQTWSGRQEQD